MKRIVALVCVLAAPLCATTARAQISAVPNSMNFQGRLAKPNGTPVADGSYSVLFSLYDALTGGTLKWSQTVPNVAVKNGVFAATLSAFPANTFNGNLWLQIKIGANPVLTPRQPLVTVAYAMKADSVKDGSITNSSIATGTLTADRFASNVLNSNAWLLGGNSGVVSGFLGTTAAQPLVFKTNNVEAMRLDVNGNFVMGGSPINAKLNVKGGTYSGIYVESTNGPALNAYDASGSASGVLASGFWGVFGSSGSVNGFGIEGDAFGGGGTGVYGRSYGMGGGNGVKGMAEVGYGVVGYGSAGGMYGASTGTSGTPAGVEGHGYYGVYGAGSTTGVYGVSSGTNGVYGSSTGFGGNGVLGECNNGIQAYGVWGKSTSGYAGYFSGNVNVTGAFTNTSDARYKKNIATFENALDVVMNLRGVTYDWRKTEFAAMNFSEGKQVGLIAQEVEKVLPELVITDGNGYKSVAYVNLIPVLVEAIKTMKSTHEAEIRVLTEENALKEARLAELEAKYKALADAVSKLQKNRK